MTQSPYRGMTVNERLVAAHLNEQWDAAVGARDLAAMIAVLGRVGLEDQANEIAGKVLANPSHYGF